MLDIAGLMLQQIQSSHSVEWLDCSEHNLQEAKTENFPVDWLAETAIAEAECGLEVIAPFHCVSKDSALEIEEDYE